MRGGDDSFLPALASGASIELASQKAIALVGHGPCRLHQSAAQPAVPLVGPAASSFAAALVVTESQTGPTGGVRRVWERRHIRAHLSHDRPGNYPLESRDAHQTFIGTRIWIHAVCDLGLQPHYITGAWCPVPCRQPEHRHRSEQYHFSVDAPHPGSGVGIFRSNDGTHRHSPLRIY